VPGNALSAILASRDVRDNKFLDLARRTGQATRIITGDSDLLDLHPFRRIPIVTPAQFIGPAAGA
jgi:uncharacterized protein